ncbi:FliI/YscN family ATPase [Paracoccus albus]|uniref:FliI/YscN family ATPase n=1 Tax=Paracoccus albus TaxID=3017784 RepID=UPI0022EFDC5A|nr:FliI/YscN family ATPase [Paracoccus albus]WBU61983.1 FliI/YscN family ATPase [Paracoccus albus]
MESIAARIARLRPTRHFGTVTEIRGGLVRVSGLNTHASIGDRICFSSTGIYGEILSLGGQLAEVLPESRPEGLSIGVEAELIFAPRLAPCDAWIGRVIDPFGQPLDGRPLLSGATQRRYDAPAPDAITRKRLGPRLDTGMVLFDTLLPVVRGQRLGLFAGSGVGKSTLLAKFARGIEAEVAVIALVGERGRELREFVESVLGPEGMARSVVIAATSDQSPLLRRRCLWAAMTVAEHFRDQNRQVLFLADSITRFAEAHREIALCAGEGASDRGFPPSTAHLIMSLVERAGPGPEGSGDITAIFSVLVAGADMDEPVADILRGVLDGHVVLDRSIAERGRFPAVDVLRSVSRALPQAANAEENRLISQARKALGAYAESELMIKAGLYAAGSDPDLDAAVRLFPALDAVVTENSKDGCVDSFRKLAAAMNQQRSI